MKKKHSYLAKLVDLIYEKHHELLPFLNLLRSDIEKIEFEYLGEDQTAQISLANKKFSILINLDFINEYKLTNDDILWLLCHEISHFILNHLHSKYEGKYSNQFRNIGYDCQVNSMLFNINERQQIDLFVKANWVNYTDFLKGEAFDFFFLVVPPSISEEAVRNDFAKLSYDSNKLDLIVEFWFKNYSQQGLSLNEIFYYLEQIIPQEENDDNDNIAEETENFFNFGDLPENIKIASKTIEENLNSKNVSAKFEEITETVIESNFNLDNIVLHKNKQNILYHSIKEAFFESKIEGNHSFNSIYDASVLPSITRKEASIIGAGYLPTFYNNRIDVETNKKLAVYIDFSNSTQKYHAEICKLLTSLKSIYHDKYFAFSDYVNEISFEDLLAGNFISSGTNIENVINHINKNRFKKVLIITDGRFSPPFSKTSAELFLLFFSKTNNTTTLENAGLIKNIWFFE